MPIWDIIKLENARDWASLQIPAENRGGRGYNLSPRSVFVYVKGDLQDFPNLPKETPNGIPIEYKFRS